MVGCQAISEILLQSRTWICLLREVCQGQKPEQEGEADEELHIIFGLLQVFHVIFKLSYFFMT